MVFPEEAGNHHYVLMLYFLRNFSALLLVRRILRLVKKACEAALTSTGMQGYCLPSSQAMVSSAVAVDVVKSMKSLLMSLKTTGCDLG